MIEQAPIDELMSTLQAQAASFGQAVSVWPLVDTRRSNLCDLHGFDPLDGLLFLERS